MIFSAASAAVNFRADDLSAAKEFQQPFQRDLPVRKILLRGINAGRRRHGRLRSRIEIAEVLVDAHPSLRPVIGAVRAEDVRVPVVDRPAPGLPVEQKYPRPFRGCFCGRLSGFCAGFCSAFSSGFFTRPADISFSGRVPAGSVSFFTVPPALCVFSAGAIPALSLNLPPKNFVFPESSKLPFFKNPGLISL